MQETQEATIDEIIGINLGRLRSDAGLTLRQAAETLTWVGYPTSEAKLSRWENGHYRFTVTDLHFLSTWYGVNVLGLLKPAEHITHIRVGRSLIPAYSYVYDFFIDPRGKFLDRARHIAERNKEGTRDIVDAINDVEDHLGEKAQLADLHDALDRIHKAFDILEAARDDIATPWDAAEYQKLVEQFSDWWKDATKDIERNPDDGINQQDT